MPEIFRHNLRRHIFGMLPAVMNYGQGNALNKIPQEDQVVAVITHSSIKTWDRR